MMPLIHKIVFWGVAGFALFLVFKMLWDTANKKKEAQKQETPKTETVQAEVKKMDMNENLGKINEKA